MQFGALSLFLGLLHIVTATTAPRPVLNPKGPLFKILQLADLHYADSQLDGASDLVCIMIPREKLAGNLHLRVLMCSAAASSSAGRGEAGPRRLLRRPSIRIRMAQIGRVVRG